MSDKADVESREGEVREVHLTEVIEIFRDYEAETMSEGYAQVWEILDEDDEYYVLRVSYMSDPQAPGRKFVRKYRKRKPE